VNVKNGEIIAGKNLANEAWLLDTDATAFKQMLKEQIDAMLQGVTLETDGKRHEIIFDDAENEVELPLATTLKDDNRLPYQLTDGELEHKLGIDAKANPPGEYVSVVFFHREPGCDTCRLMSHYVFETVKERFADEINDKSIVLRYRDFEDENNAELVKKLGIKSPSLALVRYKDGKPSRAILAWQIWTLAAEKEKFMDYVEEVVRLYHDEFKEGQP